MFKRFSICYILLMLCITGTSAQEDRWTGNATNLSKGNLRVNSSGRYLEYSDGTPFLYMGDTAWELISRLNDKETELYLENRREKGFTVIQTVILDELDDMDVSSNGEPKLIDGNIDKPAPGYFTHVDKVISLAAAKGLYIALLPTWGDKVDKQWGKGPEIFTPENAYRYGKWLGERYMNAPNLIWIIGGDRSGDGKNFAIWNALATGIKSVDKNHLMTYHPHGEHSSSFWFHNASWLDFNMCQSGHAQQDFAIYQRLLLPDLNKDTSHAWTENPDMKIFRSISKKKMEDLEMMISAIHFTKVCSAELVDIHTAVMIYGRCLIPDMSLNVTPTLHGTNQWINKEPGI